MSLLTVRQKDSLPKTAVTEISFQPQKKTTPLPNSEQSTVSSLSPSSSCCNPFQTVGNCFKYLFVDCLWKPLCELFINLFCGSKYTRLKGAVLKDLTLIEKPIQNDRVTYFRFCDLCEHVDFPGLFFQYNDSSVAQETKKLFDEARKYIADHSLSLLHLPACEVIELENGKALLVLEDIPLDLSNPCQHNEKMMREFARSGECSKLEIDALKQLIQLMGVMKSGFLCFSNGKNVVLGVPEKREDITPSLFEYLPFIPENEMPAVVANLQKNGINIDPNQISRHRTRNYLLARSTQHANLLQKYHEHGIQFGRGLLGRVQDLDKNSAEYYIVSCLKMWNEQHRHEKGCLVDLRRYQWTADRSFFSRSSPKHTFEELCKASQRLFEQGIILDVSESYNEHGYPLLQIGY